MAVTNTLAYYNTATITAVRSFIVQAPGACTIKNYKFVMYGFGSLSKLVKVTDYNKNMITNLSVTIL